MAKPGSAECSLSQLSAGRMPPRYLRNAGTIGVAGQLKLLQAKVAVVGAGGLGGHVIELLARLGPHEVVPIDVVEPDARGGK